VGFKNQNLHALFAFAKYLYRGNSAHSIHSPFVFNLYNSAIKKKTAVHLLFPETVRQELLLNENIIELKGFGAGSRNYSTKRLKVKKHAKNSLKSRSECELIFQIVQFLKPEKILELGTSFGVSTLYLNAAVPTASITTFEGEHVIQELAKKSFQGKNIESLIGDIDTVLPNFLERETQLDCVVFDANHSYEPTIRYFKSCLEKAHNESFFIIDDIYWSEGMTKAWDEIKKNPKVTISIDLYYFGIVFFRKDQAKEDFVLRKYQLIP